jgi:hypothetical protein
MCSQAEGGIRRGSGILSGTSGGAEFCPEQNVSIRTPWIVSSAVSSAKSNRSGGETVEGESLRAGLFDACCTTAAPIPSALITSPLPVKLPETFPDSRNELSSELLQRTGSSFSWGVEDRTGRCLLDAVVGTTARFSSVGISERLEVRKQGFPAVLPPLRTSVWKSC